jgi:thiamine-phosphate pyrophosphorylase
MDLLTIGLIATKFYRIKVTLMENKQSADEIRARLKLYFIMGSVNCLKDPVEVLEESIKGGITIFQYREKGLGSLTGQAKYDFGKKLQRLCRDKGVPFIVNDDLELALSLDADGMHIGQEDDQVLWIRSKIGHKILGVSAHNVEEAKLAMEQGADYLGVGPMYATQTKLDAKEVQGPTVIRQMRDSGILAPIVGIGGIALGNAAPVIHAGADGVAVISAISHAESVDKVTRQLIKEING